jgi:hypothetical protein
LSGPGTLQVARVASASALRSGQGFLQCHVPAGPHVRAVMLALATCKPAMMAKREVALRISAAMEGAELSELSSGAEFSDCAARVIADIGLPVSRDALVQSLTDAWAVVSAASTPAAAEVVTAPECDGDGSVALASTAPQTPVQVGLAARPFSDALLKGAALQRELRCLSDTHRLQFHWRTPSPRGVSTRLQVLHLVCDPETDPGDNGAQSEAWGLPVATFGPAPVTGVTPSPPSREHEGAFVLRIPARVVQASVGTLRRGDPKSPVSGGDDGVAGTPGPSSAPSAPVPWAFNAFAAPAGLHRLSAEEQHALCTVWSCCPGAAQEYVACGKLGCVLRLCTASACPNRPLSTRYLHAIVEWSDCHPGHHADVEVARMFLESAVSVEHVVNSLHHATLASGRAFSKELDLLVPCVASTSAHWSPLGCVQALQISVARAANAANRPSAGASDGAATSPLPTCDPPVDPAAPGVHALASAVGDVSATGSSDIAPAAATASAMTLKSSLAAVRGLLVRACSVLAATCANDSTWSARVEQTSPGDACPLTHAVKSICGVGGGVSSLDFIGQQQLLQSLLRVELPCSNNVGCGQHKPLFLRAHALSVRVSTDMMARPSGGFAACLGDCGRSLQDWCLYHGVPSTGTIRAWSCSACRQGVPTAPAKAPTLVVRRLGVLLLVHVLLEVAVPCNVVLSWIGLDSGCDVEVVGKRVRTLFCFLAACQPTLPAYLASLPHHVFILVVCVCVCVCVHVSLFLFAVQNSGSVLWFRH